MYSGVSRAAVCVKQECLGVTREQLGISIIRVLDNAGHFFCFINVLKLTQNFTGKKKKIKFGTNYDIKMIQSVIAFNILKNKMLHFGRERVKICYFIFISLC